MGPAHFALAALLLSLTLTGCKAQNQESARQNHLAGESSPYLLQHLYNPVDWYPWKEEALEKARSEDKLILISVGYAACHWCHVMEHESFEDSTVAAVQNRDYISIKVDREERPDVDDVYMTACQIIAQSGGRVSCGWPLNIVALPDGRPVYAGTYYPKKDWLLLLEYFSSNFRDNRASMEAQAEALSDVISSPSWEILNPPTEAPLWTMEDAQSLIEPWLSRMDGKKGGRKGAPKFPMPINYRFLLDYSSMFETPEVEGLMQTSLEAMANGGIYDHLAGGFARYSTDEDWLVPHFEKMLYDNGQLVSLYARALKRDPDNATYRRVVAETLGWIEKEMTSPEGGWYSSLDADSEGEEGKFYIWTQDEVRDVLSQIPTELPDAVELYEELYGISKRGNWEDGKNVLNLTRSPEELAAEEGIELETLEQWMAKARAALLKARGGRVRPGLDNKILTSWNALMLMGYLDAYEALEVEEYLQFALHNASFLERYALRPDGGLNRNYMEGKSSINAFLDDYGLLASAYLRLYEVTFDEHWFDLSIALTDYAIEHFHDKQDGLFFYTSDLDDPLIARKKEVDDNVIASSNAVMATVLLRLSHMVEPDRSERYRMMAERQMLAMSSSVRSNSFYAGQWAQVLLELTDPGHEIVVVGRDAAAYRRMLQSRHLPRAVFAGSESDKSGRLEESQVALLEGKAVKGETLIYICRNRVCKLPARNPEEALNQLGVR